MIEKSESENQARRRVLIMDDEEPIRLLVMKVLGRKGLEVVSACNGSEALEIIGAAFPQNPFHLLILDLNIVGGRGALSILPDIRKLDPQVKIVICSGLVDAPGPACPPVGDFAAMLSKPFNLNELRDLADRLLAPTSCAS